jgi:hypothetical protein
MSVFCEEGLTVRKESARKGAIGTRAPIAIPQVPIQRWALDIVSGALSNGRRFRNFCSLHYFNRECLATVVDTSLTGFRLTRELDRIAAIRLPVSDPPFDKARRILKPLQFGSVIVAVPPTPSDRRVALIDTMAARVFSRGRFRSAASSCWAATSGSPKRAAKSHISCWIAASLAVT